MFHKALHAFNVDFYNWLKDIRFPMKCLSVIWHVRVSKVRSTKKLSSKQEPKNTFQMHRRASIINVATNG